MMDDLGRHEMGKVSIPNIAILGTILVQTGLAMFWAGSLDNKVAGIEKHLDRVTAQLEELKTENRRLSERVTRIEK